ncbi:MAG TPA: ABC transporter ATP-binding protein [bacterium]|nr:ABC transporter ATP-binding protein [bacterium]
MTAVFTLEEVTKRFPRRGGGAPITALDRVSLTLRPGEILGLAGESGSGKSTMAELLVRLQTPTEGRIRFDGGDLAHLSGETLHAFRRRVQMIFQDPYESINPRFTVRGWVEEPLLIHRTGGPAERLAGVREALERAELRPPDAFLDLFPHHLSGGQRQRLSIARAIVAGPSVLVADEPVSMLDVSVRGGILRLLRALRETLGLAIVYISHDLSTVRQITDRVAVLYRGSLVEIGPTEAVMREPRHPYTQALLSAIPTLSVDGPPRRRVALPLEDGPVPEDACRFAPRCPHVMPVCRERRPALVEQPAGHAAACFLHAPDAVAKTSAV